MKDLDQYWRYSFVGALLCAAAIGIVLRIMSIQADPQRLKQLEAEIEQVTKVQKTIVPARGQIYDRWGNLLAGNKKVYEIGVELQDVEDPQFIAHAVSMIVPDIKYEYVFSMASLKPSPSAVYATLTRFAPQEAVDKLELLKKQLKEDYVANGKDAPSLRGLVYYPHLERYYPEKALASNILGFVSRDNQGYFGVEERFNELLSGKARTVLVPTDPNRVEEMPEVPNGASLVLTIEREVQLAMEEIIDDAVAETGSASGTLVVMNPKTGEIIAMATTPRIDLNEYWRLEEVFPPGSNIPFNRAVGQAYEPGSVFKPLTMAIALDTGAVTPDTVFVDTGSIEVGGIFIVNWNRGAWGPQDMTGCLQHSLNVCLAWVATQIGPNNFYRGLQAFGLGHLTGVDLAGEVAGRLKAPGDNDWFASDLGTNSFGQGIAVTPVQMAAAISAIANNGVMMAPKIVRSVINDGYQHDIEQRVIGMPIKPETARTLSEMLARSLEKESSDALVPGYRVAGKTGTAEIPIPGQGYTSNQTNASFVGWGPVDDPQFLVYVWLEKPSTSPWGSVVAAPVFRRAVEKLVIYLNLPPDDVRRRLASSN